MIAGAFFSLLVFSSVAPEGALRAALEHSPDVAAARARVDEASAALDAARGALVPSLTGNYAQAPQGNPPGPNVTQRLATLGLQTNVADFVAYGPAVRESLLLFESARDDAFVAERTERLKTLGLYFGALKARAALDARTRALELASAQRDAAQKRLDAGDAPRLDVVRAEVALAQASADLETARAADANASDALVLETGFGVSAFTATRDSEGEPAAGADPDPMKSVALALGTRAEIASAVAAAHAQEAARQAASASGFPNVLVGAGYAEGTDSGVPVRAPTVDVALTLPLGPGARDRVKTESGRTVEALAKVENARRDVALEVGASARSVAALRRAAAASARAREQAAIELTATQLGYRSGATSSLDVRSAQATYVQALVEESTAAYDVAKAVLTLEIETGP